MIDCESDRADLNEGPQHLEMAGQFVLSLIQALLRTGYYLPDHPESRKAKGGIYEHFAILSKRSGEITLYIGEDKGKRAILMEGIDDTPIKLTSIMQLGMAETYMPRIILFLERKELACLTLKKELTENEFYQLIDILSEPPVNNMDGVAARELFVRTLQQQNIHNISFIFREDIISSRSTLPWRVRMALSRLKKDLSLIPILRNLQKEELHQVKMQVLSDILRPLTLPQFAYAFLLNLDLAASSMVSEEEGEKRFFDLSSDSLILDTARLFLHDATAKAKEGFPEHVTAEKISRLQAEFCRRLGSSDDHKAAALLESFFDYGLIAFEDLPESLKNRIEKIKRMGVFLGQPERFLAAFDSITELSMYESRSRILASFVPILLEREHVAEAVTIVEMIVKHIQGQSVRTPLAIACRTEIAFGGALGLASSIFLSASKETRTVIGKLFTLIGSEAVQHMQSILINSDDPWKSKQAAEILINLGEPAVAALFAAVESNQINRTSLPAVVRVISECTPADQKESAANLLRKLVNSSRPEIRCEVLTGLSRIGAVGSFTIFKANSEDPDIHIRKVAISGIGRSTDPRGATLLVALIEKGGKGGKEEDQEIASTAVESLGILMASCPAIFDMGLTCLASLVEQCCTHSTWKKLLPGSSALPEFQVLSLTETLGRLRGESIQKHLLKLSQHHNPVVAKRAAELINRY
jgi:hypothetical protein